MNLFAALIPTNSQTPDWLMFMVMLAAIGLGVAIVGIWAVLNRNKDKKRRRKRRHRHSRQHNPTLAQRGGLPPQRDPNQPPSGL